jgi:hypothetical protein
MKFLKVLLAATLVIPCSVIAQVPVATFEVDQLKIPSLNLNNQNYKNLVVKYLGGMDFDVTQFQETTDPIIHYASKFESGKLVVNALELGNETYANLLFDYVGGTSLKLGSFKGPIKELSFKQTDFLLVEPKEWKTNERVYSSIENSFINNIAESAVNDFLLIDIDRDGLKDLLIAGIKVGDGLFIDEAVPLRWLKNTGDGFELGESSIFPDSSARRLLFNMWVADFNNDGIDDFFGPSLGYDNYPFIGEANLLLLSDEENGYKDVSIGDPNFDYLGFTHGSGIGDINNDGNIDIVTVDNCTPQNQIGVRILVNDGKGQFTQAKITRNTEKNEPCPGWMVSLIDLNNDGYDELIIGSHAFEVQEDRIYWNDKSGEFDLSRYTNLPGLITFDGKPLNDTLSIYGTDINYDGLIDIVMSKSERYVGKGIQILSNNGDKTFSDVTDTYSPWANIETGSSGTMEIPYQIRELDINNDGLLDIRFVYSQEQSYNPLNRSFKNHSYFWIKQQDGSYEELSTEILDQKGWFWLIDYDEDGDIDIINRSSRFQQRSGEESYLSDEIFEWRILENESL